MDEIDIGLKGSSFHIKVITISLQKLAYDLPEINGGVREQSPEHSRPSIADIGRLLLVCWPFFRYTFAAVGTCGILRKVCKLNTRKHPETSVAVVQNNPE